MGDFSSAEMGIRFLQGLQVPVLSVHGDGCPDAPRLVGLAVAFECEDV
ncbi:hypothetical protein ACH4GK_06065 [Streptomyces rimosus]|nr:hypothetical protein [Streptomyces rimosus]